MLEACAYATTWISGVTSVRDSIFVVSSISCASDLNFATVRNLLFTGYYEDVQQTEKKEREMT